MTFADKLILFRATYRLNQTQLADILECSVMSVYKYENRIATPSKRNLLFYETKMKEYEKANSEKGSTHNV